MKQGAIACLILAALTRGSDVHAVVDESPLDVGIVSAFPQLQWPDDLTGADRGLRRDVRPLVVTGAGDGSNRLFVATQYGTIHALPNNANTAQAPIFLDLRDKVAFDVNQNEEGFLGLAFHPRFAENGEFFVKYTANRADQPERMSIVSRFRVSPANASRADPDHEEILLRIPQPYWNHNGGTLVFGPDGYLYIAVGDGGAAHDPHGHGQNLETVLGSILRIDVDRTDSDRPYGVPSDNPFVGKDPSVRDEIWAYGLRNVWRLTFDRKTGVAWAGDVGQDQWEEINLIRRGGNYGWNLREGMHSFGPNGSDVSPSYIEPIWEYHHDVGKSITGGHVYRGKAVPELAGAYLYADYVSGRIWALWYDPQSEVVTANRTLRESGPPILTFGEDDQGEQYFTTQAGGIFKFAPSSETP